MRAAISCHLHGILDQSEQLHRQLVDVQDVTEDHLHILHNKTRQHGATCFEVRKVRLARLNLKISLVRESLRGVHWSVVPLLVGGFRLSV